MSLFRTKPIDQDEYRDNGLRRCLSTLDLTMLGIGAIIGAGIFVLTGVAAATKAGPAIVLSYVVAGFACAFAALAYAELAATVGGCGSAYGYAYAGFGELIAWLIGWDLLLEYAISTPTVAIGWSGYVNNALVAIGIHVPLPLLHAPTDGGIVNLPAALIIIVLGCLLAIGVRMSARFNATMVFIKLTAILIFVTIATVNIVPAYWHPFIPFGWPGVMAGAALIFFAYIGFDAVSTAAEEAIDPRRGLPTGIIASLSVCTVIYILMAGLLTGITSYTTLNTASPVAETLLGLGYRWAAGIVAAGAVAGLTTVMLVLYYALTRIVLAMSRDGLLPPVLAAVHPATRTPTRTIFGSGMIMALVAGFLPIGTVAELVNIGTLAAFVLVCAGVIYLRHTQPDLPRSFRTPWSPLIPSLGVLSCLYLMANLPLVTWGRFFIWMILGLLVYFLYSRRHSSLAMKV